MNSKIIISSLFVLLAVSCKDNSKQVKTLEQVQSKPKKDSILITKLDTTSFEQNKEKIEQDINQIVPDTTINNKLFMKNYESTSKFYPKDLNLSIIDNGTRESPFVVFSDKSKTQYLLAYQYEGGTKNSFDSFEIGYFVDDQRLSKVLASNIDENFKTESNLTLGISLEELVKIKGDGYTTKKEKNVSILTYRIDNYNESLFLKRYDMPGYFMEFTLKNNKVTKILFGFDYP